MHSVSMFDSMAVRCAAAVIAGISRHRSLAILTFHRVLAEPDDLLPSEPDAKRFSVLLDLLGRGFRVLELRDALSRLQAGSLPARAACITFDDGYANNCEIAMPLLQHKGMPATVFIATGYLNGGAMFNDVVIAALRNAPSTVNLAELELGSFELGNTQARRSAISRILNVAKYWPAGERRQRADRLALLCGLESRPKLMMSGEQVIQLHRNGFEIGAHTVSHPILSRLDPQQVQSELKDSKKHLESLLGSPVTAFAYPNGVPGRDYRREHVQLVREAGFTVAVTTAWGTATGESDLLQLPRVSPAFRSPRDFGLRLAMSFRDQSGAKAA